MCTFILKSSLIDTNGATSELANPVLAQVSILVGLEAKSLLKSFALKIIVLKKVIK